jgi:hypothetical protein
MSGTTTRKYGTRKIVYPLLARIAEVATDEWWKAYMADCSRGALPKGVTLSGSVVSYVHASEIAHYELSPDPPAAYKELCAFFALHPKVAPTSTHIEHAERARRTSETKKKRTSRAGTAAGDATRSAKKPTKTRRLAMLARFVEQVRDAYRLDVAQVASLRHALWIADLRGVLEESMTVEDGFINAVACVKYDGERFFFEAPPGERRPPHVLRVPAPPNLAYRGYPSKQLDPAVLIDAHLKALSKRRANAVVKKASGMLGLASSPSEDTEQRAAET